MSTCPIGGTPYKRCPRVSLVARHIKDVRMFHWVWQFCIFLSDAGANRIYVTSFGDEILVWYCRCMRHDNGLPQYIEENSHWCCISAVALGVFNTSQTSWIYVLPNMFQVTNVEGCVDNFRVLKCYTGNCIIITRIRNTRNYTTICRISLSVTCCNKAIRVWFACILRQPKH